MLVASVEVTTWPSLVVATHSDDDGQLTSVKSGKMKEPVQSLGERPNDFPVRLAVVGIADERRRLHACIMFDSQRLARVSDSSRTNHHHRYNNSYRR